MREILINLSKSLGKVVPTFVHVPQKTPYPYISLEPERVLVGLPWGPKVASFSVKIWSRYAGTIEILKIAKDVEALILSFEPYSLKIRESHLELLKDGQTRLHTFKLKTRIPGVSR